MSYLSGINMREDWQEMARRAKTRGASGELLSFATGQESLDELQDLCLQLASKCPIDRDHHACPFRMLGKLPIYSVKNLISEMSETDLRELLTMELICRKIALNGQNILGDSNR
jgi:hypothetical protein